MESARCSSLFPATTRVWLTKLARGLRLPATLSDHAEWPEDFRQTLPDLREPGTAGSGMVISGTNLAAPLAQATWESDTSRQRGIPRLVNFKSQGGDHPDPPQQPKTKHMKLNAIHCKKINPSFLTPAWPSIRTRVIHAQAVTRGAGLVLALILAGCASTTISNREILVNEKLPRPAHIWVYDFASTPDDVPSDSALAGAPVGAAQTDEQVALGRQLGIAISSQLVQEINDMGLPAVAATKTSSPQVNDLVIRGYLVSVDPGSATKRMTIGFGSGGSELETMVEGYQMTPKGLRKLGSGTSNSEGGKGPGAAVGGATWLITGNPIGLIVGGGMKVYGEASGSSTIEGRGKATAKEIAQVLKDRFERQGWID